MRSWRIYKFARKWKRIVMSITATNVLSFAKIYIQ